MGKKLALNRRNFLKTTSISAATALIGGPDILGNTLPNSGSMNLNQWLSSNSSFEKPANLSKRTHELAEQMLSGQWGRKIANATFALPESAKDLSPNMQYATAAKCVAENAPIWIHPGALVVGSATIAEGRNHFIPLITNVYSVSHTTIGFDKVLTLGYKGIRAKINERLSRDGLDTEGKELLNSMLRCLDAADIWHKRHIDELEKRISSSTGQEKETYIKVHKASINVPENPPTTFHEAVQSFRFAFGFQKLMGNWSGLGRIDEMFGPYLKQDIANGNITIDEAREILAHFWILGSEWTLCYEQAGGGDAQHYQNVLLGGIDENGNEVTNEVTYLALDIVEELLISDFPIAVRINRNTPKELLAKVAKVQRHGGGIVALYNEEVVIDGLVKFGYALKEARKFANDGCWEVLIPGKTTFSYYPSDMLQELQLSIGLKDDRPIDDNKSFEDIYTDFESALKKTCQRMMEESKDFYRSDQVCPLLSILVDDCIERGKSYLNRGSRYTVSSPHMGGMADTANSLLVINELVYEQKAFSLSEFINIVRNDWKDHEHLRSMVRNRITSYGNDNEKADMMMQRVFNSYTCICAGCKENGGVLMPAGISTFGRELAWLPGRMATPSGHKKGDILATNFSPTPGSDIKGPTAVINSYTNMDFTRAPGGATLELKLHPASVKGPDGINAMVALMKTFQKRGGWYIHMDVVDSALLLDAQQHPEKYPNLPVRIAGWSARFATLTKEWQDIVIQRTQQII